MVNVFFALFQSSLGLRFKGENIMFGVPEAADQGTANSHRIKYLQFFPHFFAFLKDSQHSFPG